MFSGVEFFLCVEICGARMINANDKPGKGCKFQLHAIFLLLFFRCCQQTQKNHGRCTAQPRIVREGVSAPSWRPNSPCVLGTPAPNS